MQECFNEMRRQRARGATAAPRPAAAWLSCVPRQPRRPPPVAPPPPSCSAAPAPPRLPRRAAPASPPWPRSAHRPPCSRLRKLRPCSTRYTWQFFLIAAPHATMAHCIMVLSMWLRQARWLTRHANQAGATHRAAALAAAAAAASTSCSAAAFASSACLARRAIAAFLRSFSLARCFAFFSACPHGTQHSKSAGTYLCRNRCRVYFLCVQPLKGCLRSCGKTATCAPAGAGRPTRQQRCIHRVKCRLYRTIRIKPSGAPPGPPGAPPSPL